MKPRSGDIPAQFIVDNAGKKTAVILDIKTFEKLLDELEDFYLGELAQAALKQEQEWISHDEVKQQLEQRKSKK